MKKFLIISSFILVFLAISTIGYTLVSASDKANEIPNILVTQSNKEAYLTPYGYTLDNPNIILDPYGISPLTALILFETEEELPVTITIEGKDHNSTYTNTFINTRRHYIPVYGLYPNTINHIQIKCGEEIKTIEIETSPLPDELLMTEVTNNDTNQLTFITSDTYPYALDNNNEVRWYLTKNYSKKIDYLENGHLLLSDETINSSNNPTGLVEIDLLGKIYKQYILDTSYLGSYTETPTSLYILSTKLLELEKQTGTILNTITLEDQYNEVFYNQETNTLNLKNETNILTINLQTKEQTINNESNPTNEKQKLLSLYTTNNHYNLTRSIKIDLTKETKQSDKNIFLVGYIEPNKIYNNYNINITKTTDNIQITGSFNTNDEVYLILDKFLDKRVYDIKDYLTIINKQGLTGQYSIYIKINDTIYKTNNYIKF